MESPRGGICRDSEHIVKTLDIAREWHSEVDESQIPITVNQKTAPDGRVLINVFTNDGKLIHRRG